jgi:VIT1/CCC1 family predicted Fe2+/Mn2+ transporter
MAAGEFVSVSSQSDTERADLQRERRELKNDPEGEKRELAAIYVRRGLDKPLAMQVAEKLMAKDALGAHAQDELGISKTTQPRPLQAAIASAASFSSGAFLPILAVLFVSRGWAPISVSAASLVGLAVLGVVGAEVGGAPRLKAALRVVLWGVLAMGVTFLAGRLFGAKL